MLAQMEYKKRHENVCWYIHCRLCRKHGFEGATQWYKHELDGVIKSNVFKILWDFTINGDTKIEALAPDIDNIDKTQEGG